MLYAEPFDGLEGLAERLKEAALFARVHDYTKPAIESREAAAGREPRLELYAETLSDRSVQLVAVVCA
jgi:hypothetical protein